MCVLLWGGQGKRSSVAPLCVLPLAWFAPLLTPPPFRRRGLPLVGCAPHSLICPSPRACPACGSRSWCAAGCKSPLPSCPSRSSGASSPPLSAESPSSSSVCRTLQPAHATERILYKLLMPLEEYIAPPAHSPLPDSFLSRGARTPSRPLLLWSMFVHP